jgi:N-acetylmuramoyl-L-alanine amidase
MTPIIIAQYSQAFLTQSIVVGAKINNVFASQGRVTEGLRQQSLQVLASSAMPGVLVEIGYLNNTEEEAYLNTEEGQMECARAIFEGIKFYKEESEKEPVQVIEDR